LNIVAHGVGKLLTILAESTAEIVSHVRSSRALRPAFAVVEAGAGHAFAEAAFTHKITAIPQ